MISFTNVNVQFQNQGQTLKVVKKVNFSVGKGEIFAIVGTSGAGKSTLLRTVNGLQKISSGQVKVNGTDVSCLKDKELLKFRQSIGMIFQSFNLIGSRTVEANLRFALEAGDYEAAAIPARIDELLGIVQLSDKKHSYPQQLSGGQKQRVAIARALANHPQILLCDEATSALDTETTDSVLRLLKEIRDQLGLTILLITHEIDVVKQICDRVAVMQNGEIVELNKAYSLFTAPQHALTKQLLALSDRFVLPDEMIKKLSGHLLRLKYHGEAAKDAVLSETAKQYAIQVNILLGKIEYIAGQALGQLYIEMRGAEDARNEALSYLKERVAEVEEINYA